METSIPKPAFLNLDYLFSRLTNFFVHLLSYIFSARFLGLLHTIASILVVLMIASILYSLVRLYEIRQTEKTKAPSAVAESAGTQMYTPAITIPVFDLPSAAPPAPPPPKENPTWNDVRTKMLSDTPSDWRLGIIEADIYLDRVLRDKGYAGDTLADKLKAANENDFPSLNIAWEAHKIRNRIAHQGAEFTLTQPEARRVLSYFEIVFRDLGAIE